MEVGSNDELSRRNLRTEDRVQRVLSLTLIQINKESIINDFIVSKLNHIGDEFY
jgi:hypothetical protein